MTGLSVKHLKMLGCKVELDTNLDVNHCNKCSTSVQTVRTMADHDSNYECHSYVLDNFTSEDYNQLSAALDKVVLKEKIILAGTMTKGQATGGISCMDCGVKIWSTECSYCSKCCTVRDCLVH